MYIFNSFYLLHWYNPSFLICLCFNMVSFRDPKKAWATPRSISFRGFNSKFPTSIPTLSYAEFSPGLIGPGPCTTFIRIPIILNLLTNRNIALIYSVTICEEKTKDCARSGSFQYYLQHRCFQLWCLPAFLTNKKPNCSCSFGFPTFWNKRRLTLDCFRRGSSPFRERSLPFLRWLTIEVTSEYSPAF